MGNSSSYKNGEEEKLNETDVKLIVSVWEVLPDKDAFGQDVMIRIFQEHSAIKNKWIFATNLETEAEMLSNPQVRYHANKIIGVFDRMIANLTVDGRTVVDDLDRLGKSHFYYEVKRTDFKHFEESMLFMLKKHVPDKKIFTARCEKAWQKAFWLIANKIADGIEAEEAKKAAPKNSLI